MDSLQQDFVWVFLLVHSHLFCGVRLSILSSVIYSLERLLVSVIINQNHNRQCINKTRTVKIQARTVNADKYTVMYKSN